jgi:O-antigen/teichoic acid export membrane protein
MSLRERTVTGLLWSFLEDLTRNGLASVCGLVLARLLTPREFGLIGMTTIFIGVSQAFVEGGFSQALIRKQDCTSADYSTVFIFNVLVSSALFFLLWFASGAIGRFFGEPQLAGIIPALSLGLIIGALGQVHRTQIFKALDFKLLTRISIVSSMIGGALGIALACAGYGVWSLVVMTLSRATVELVLLRLWRAWRPALEFRWSSFREMFAFGSRLLFSGLIGILHLHTYNLFIGKVFSAVELGYFTQACTFRNLPPQRLTEVVHRVSYPVLVTLQQDAPRLKAAYRRMLQSSILVSFVLMLGMAASAESMLIAVVGEQWRPAVAYLQLLCLAGVFHPLHAVNLSMFHVRGRSDLSLKLSVIKTASVVPAMVVGVFWGIKAMIVAMFFTSFANYVLTATWSGRLIGYRLAEQLRDILPPLALAAAMAAVVHSLGQWLPIPDLPKLLAQVGAGAILAVGLAELTRLDSYLYLKEVALNRLLSGKRFPDV